MQMQKIVLVALLLPALALADTPRPWQEKLELGVFAEDSRFMDSASHAQLDALVKRVTQADIDAVLIEGCSLPGESGGSRLAEARAVEVEMAFIGAGVYPGLIARGTCREPEARRVKIEVLGTR